MRLRVRRNVDLPHPDGPIRAVTIHNLKIHREIPGLQFFPQSIPDLIGEMGKPHPDVASRRPSEVMPSNATRFPWDFWEDPIRINFRPVIPYHLGGFRIDFAPSLFADR